MGALIAFVVEFARTHQGLAYGLILVVSFSEALPAFGAFVPGDAVILGVSALAPSGAVQLLPLMIAAASGAIMGDGFSYWIGSRYRRSIVSYWPMNRYPELTTRGEDFFQRHGGKSIFIARFTPGVRAIVPLMAGMLRLPPFRFYTMNVASAVAWSVTHILAGAAIGASLTLLGAIAGRLAVLFVVLAALIAVLTWAARYSARRLPPLLTEALRRLRLWAGSGDGWIRRQILSILDPARKELPGLAILGAVLIASLWSLIGVLQDLIAGDPLVRADQAVFHFLQALRTAWFDQLMAALSELGASTVTGAVTFTTLLWLAWRRNWRGAAYECAAVSASVLFVFLLKITFRQPRPYPTYSGWDAFTFPSGHSAVNAALYGFLAIAIAWEVNARWRFAASTGAAFFVAAIAFSRLYLGAHWISDVLAGLAFGVAWAASLAIAYLRRDPPPIGARGLSVVIILTLASAGAATIESRHQGDLLRYAAHEQIRTLPASRWLEEAWSQLPARRIDLAGEVEEPLTLQWAGPLSALQSKLEQHGWRQPIPWSVHTALEWLAPNVQLSDLPVLPRLEDGNSEAFVLVRPDRKNGDRLVLRLWRSNIDLQEADSAKTPLWIGTADEERSERILSILTIPDQQETYNKARNILSSELPRSRLVMRGRDFQQKGWDGGVLLAHASPLPISAPP